MNYSRRQLEAFGEPLGESVTRLKPFGRIYGSGGGGGATSSTVTQTTIPEYLRPQVEGLLGGSMQELFDFDKSKKDAEGNPIYDMTRAKPFVPYGSKPEDYVAGFQPMQTTAQANVANLRVPQQYGQGTDIANVAARGGLDTANQAGGYGQAGFQSGQQGQFMGGQAAQRAAMQANQAAQGAYGYGNMGVQAGFRGESIGEGALTNALGRADMATRMAQQAGAEGQQSGRMGQQVGMQGGQFYGSQGADYGGQAASMAGRAQGFGQEAANIGGMGLRAEQYGRQVSGQAEDFARQSAAAQDRFTRQVTDPSTVEQFMSPYQQAVTDNQVAAARRQSDISRSQRGAAAARSGAFGGARQAIENAEAEKNLQSQLSGIQATGRQSAYDKAMQNIQFGSSLGLQGLGGAQSGLGTALQGGQLGLSGIGTALQGQQAGLAGLSAANQFYGTGIQGSQVGLSGLDRQLAGSAQGMQGAGLGLSAADRAISAGQLAQQGAQTGLSGTGQAMQGAGVGLSGVGQAINAGQFGLQGTDRGLAGTAQGMQGAQSGLSGVGAQQAGFALAGQMAGTMGQLGDRQLAAQQNILNMQNQYGAQQQAYQQQLINQAIQTYAAQREAPINTYNQYNALLRGYALPGQTTNQYQAQPNIGSQIAGLGTAGIAGLGLYNASQPRG